MTVLDLSPGKLLAGRYKVVGPNRPGGLAAALEVRDAETGDGLELQLFPSHLFESAEQARSFAAGLEPWKQVRSPAVLRVLEVLEIDSSHLALVTDLPVGEALRHRLAARGCLAEAEVLIFGTRLLAGLDAVHDAGLVHGDIKPHAVHVTDGSAGPEPQLVDGGITPGLWRAKGLGDKTTLIGTPYYAPIEQFGGDAPDVRSDLYNVAAVLYECLTGALPWPGVNFLEVFQAKLEPEPPPMRERAPDVSVDAALEAAVRRGCRADRRERYASAEEFRAALAELA